MKTTLYAVGSAVLLLIAPAALSADTLTQTLQHGLFEEEANQNLDAAIKSYQSVIAQSDEQRKLVGTALFRLGECYRKLGKTNEATAQFRRILRDFSDQEQLATLSRETLGKLGAAPPPAENLVQAKTSDDAQALARYRAMVSDSPDLVNSRDQRGYTPLHAMADLGHTSAAEFLIAHGANVNATDNGGKTPLYLAASKGHKRIVELLLGNGAQIDARAAGNGTALFAAAQSGYISIVEVLLQHKADVNAIGWSDQQSLHAAARLGYLNIVSVLIKHGAELEHQSDFVRVDDSDRRLGGTPLHLAAGLGYAEIVRLLLKEKAQVNSLDKDGITPLRRAAEVSHTEVVKILLEAGADPNILSTAGNNALASIVNLEVIQLLITKNAQVNVTNKAGSTPLGLLVHGQAPAPANAIELLLKNGANPNATTEGAPLLNYAVRVANVAIADLLLRYGARPDFVINGETPLSIAKQNSENSSYAQVDRTRFAQIHDLLVEHGADPDYLRRSRISFTRVGWNYEVPQWTRDPNGVNRYTLFELLNGLTRNKLEFADLEHIEIERLDPTNATSSTIHVDLAGALDSGSCTNDFWLQWGDRIVIREREHPLGETWNFPEELRDLLEKCGTRRVQIVVKAGTNTVVLKPRAVAYHEIGGAPRRVVTPPSPPKTGEQDRTLSTFRLKDVILSANVLRTSSDLSRVRVTRTNPVTSTHNEWTFDLTQTEPIQSSPNNFGAPPRPMPVPQPGAPASNTNPRVTPYEHDLWLRDGDLIEIPEKR